MKSNVGALERLMADVALESTGERGERCLMRSTLPLYVGDGGQFERTFCCYGNDVDCTRCGAYAVVRAECAPQDMRNVALLAQTFGSEEARQRGVVDELRPSDAVLERALEVARDMAAMPADSYRRIKHQVRRTAIAEIEEVVTGGAEPMLDGWFDAGAREASAAHLESPARRSS